MQYGNLYAPYVHSDKEFGFRSHVAFSSDLLYNNWPVTRDTHIMLFKVPIMLCSNSQH